MSSLLLAPELPWLFGGLAGYGAGAAAAWHGLWRDRPVDRTVFTAVLAGVVLLATAITLRWMRAGYGPFLTLFEVLLSNLFSLGLVFLVVFWRVPLSRPAALVVLPVFLMLGCWSATLPVEPGQLPATYETGWLWVHVGVGKVFLGICLAAVGLSGILLLRRMPGFEILNRLPGDGVLDALVWRFMSVAFVFHSLMLIAGAVWAQDAWGHFWTWDPLETWAFITWLMLGLSLHARLAWKVPLWGGWLMVIGVFILAFLTFFGVPFSSLGPHKGVI
jgi:ABC-type transport system involved in cytochrome c biogenesis permease subunit